MTMRRLYFVISLISILCISLLISSCDDDPASVNDEPPKLPPVQSMEADFSDFESQQEKTQPQVESSDNFQRAVSTAFLMKAAIEFNLAIPRALLTAAKNADAELNEDEQWEWSFSKSTDGKTFGVRLVGSREGENTVNWQFFVTNSQLGLEDHLFFSGTTNSDETEGVWTYYSLQDTANKEEVSRIEWTVNGEDDVQLRLDVSSDRNGNKGDYIDYTFDGTLKTATYHDSSEDEETTIQINVDNEAGYIIAPEYNNGNKACWDENFQDITCNE